MKDWVTISLLLLGGVFMLIAALGILRLPDLFNRIQASTKAGTLGKIFILFGVALHFDDLGVTTQALLVVGFFFLTAPIGAHVIARSAYVNGVPLWTGSVMDELRGYYTGEGHMEPSEQIPSGSDGPGPEARAPEEETPSGPP